METIKGVLHYNHNIQNHSPESSNEISELSNLLPVNTGNQAASDDGCEVCSIQRTNEPSVWQRVFSWEFPQHSAANYSLS